MLDQIELSGVQSLYHKFTHVPELYILLLNLIKIAIELFCVLHHFFLKSAIIFDDYKSVFDMLAWEPRPALISLMTADCAPSPLLSTIQSRR